MKRIIFLSFFIFFVDQVKAQHCPWDCTGLLMIRTDVEKWEMETLNPVLVDANRNVVVDTLYGTGKNTFDTCKFLEYDEFSDYRKERSKLHKWYDYDSMLEFAKGFYIVRYNFCKFKDGANGAPLYIRYMGPGHGHFHYIVVPTNKRIHLHDHNNNIRDKNHEAILKEVEPKIIQINRAEWGFQ